MSVAAMSGIASPLEDHVSAFVGNPVHFAAECVQHDGLCTIARDNFVFLDDGNELAAVDLLQMKCGRVVIIPDSADKGRALLYHTSCDRMTDAIRQIFSDRLGAPASLPRITSEMTVGELHRRPVAISYDECRAKVEGFSFPDASAA
jgi:hypothetical protein